MSRREREFTGLSIRGQDGLIAGIRAVDRASMDPGPVRCAAMEGALLLYARSRHGLRRIVNIGTGSAYAEALRRVE